MGITGVVENKGRFPKVRTGQLERHFEGNRSSRTKVILHETRIISRKAELCHPKVYQVYYTDTEKIVCVM